MVEVCGTLKPQQPPSRASPSGPATAVSLAAPGNLTCEPPCDGSRFAGNSEVIQKLCSRRSECERRPAAPHSPQRDSRTAARHYRIPETLARVLSLVFMNPSSPSRGFQVNCKEVDMSGSEAVKRGSQKLIAQLSQKGESITVEDVRAALNVSNEVQFKLLRWHVRGLPPAEIELNASLGVAAVSRRDRAAHRECQGPCGGN